MSLIPLWVKALIVAALLTACSWGVHLYNQSIRDDQRAVDVAEYSAKLIAAQEDARAKEAAWRAKDKAQQEKTNDEINKRDAQYAVLSRTTDSLRDTATNYGNGLSTDSIGACRERAATLAKLFGECTSALVGVAKAADGQHIDSVSCRESWPQ